MILAGMILNEQLIESAAEAIFRVHNPGEENIPIHIRWAKWPETPRDASLAQEAFSKQEYREFARAALEVL